MSTAEFNLQLSGFSGVLQAFAYNLTKNSDEAKDLFQETAYRALMNREKFNPGTNFKAWLFTIMKNVFINNYRKKTKSSTILDSTDNLYYLNSGDNYVNNGGETTIMMTELQGMVKKLDETIQVPFVMHYEGYKYQEIADHLQLPLGTVKSRIFFARKELKDVVEYHYGIKGKIQED